MSTAPPGGVLQGALQRLPIDNSGCHLALSHEDMVREVVLPGMQDWVRFVPELGKEGRFVVRDFQTLVWDGSPKAQHEAVAMVATWIRTLLDGMTLKGQTRFSMGSHGYRKSVLACLAEEPTIIRHLDDWDVHPHELQTPGGVVDLITGAMRPTALSDFNLQCTAVIPMWGDKPVFDAVLASGFMFAPEHAAYFRTQLGASLFGENTEHALRWLIGQSGTGKSSVLMAVRICLGSYARMSDSTLFVAAKDERLSPLQEKAAMGRLARARFALCDEINRNGRLNSRVIKTITNNDMAETEDKYQPVREALVRANVWITANNMPDRIEGGEAGFERRMQIVEMNGLPVHDDKAVRDKLAEEHPQILAWLIDAAGDWFMFGPAPAPPGSTMLVSTLTEAVRFVPRWWSARWEFTGDDTHRVFAADLWKDFAQVWWPSQDEAKARAAMGVPVSEIEFYRQVRDLVIRGCAKGDNSFWSDQLQIKGERRSGYRGVNKL